jgi:hypothetical protein
MNEELYKKMLLYFKDMKHKSYSDLNELAELDLNEHADMNDECKLMDYALYKVLRCGAAKDKADAIKYYMSYVLAAKMISLPR